ncbi:MAG TPA: hypothetical protein VER55_00755 [Ardenticatenaceae bacterium]|nr:hypothetical protein [Ardenticatenaceae bacterium]
MRAEQVVTGTTRDAVSTGAEASEARGDARLRRLAWLLWVVAVLTAGAGLALFVMSAGVRVPELWGLRGFPAIFALAFATVGALVVSRHPRNLVGWIFCCAGANAGFTQLIEEYLIYAHFVRPGALPGVTALVWLHGWLWIPQTFSVVFVALFFPDGRLPSPRWRPVAWAGVLGLIAFVVFIAFEPRPIESGLGIGITNPVGIAALGPFLDVGLAAAALVILAAVIASALSVFLRLRRSSGVERQQLKWFVYSVGLAILVFPAATLNSTLAQVLVMIAVLGIPTAIGIAILRYRLYDIDILINRTLVYGLLTGALGLVYFGSVVLLQALFRLLTGQGDDFAIIVSTLGIAALFQPLRRRIQAAIDRRFYRRKYDAEQVLAAFSTTLRDEVDLDRLTVALLGVVEETVQPAHVSVWLRKGAVNIGLGSSAREKERLSEGRAGD